MRMGHYCLLEELENEDDVWKNPTSAREAQEGIYQLNEGPNRSLRNSPLKISGVCATCAPSLAQISDGFKHWGTELKERE